MKMSINDLKNPIITGVLSGVVGWVLKELSEVVMKHIESFLITFSPLIIGLLVFFIHLLIKRWKKVLITEMQSALNERIRNVITEVDNEARKKKEDEEMHRNLRVAGLE